MPTKVVYSNSVGSLLTDVIKVDNKVVDLSGYQVKFNMREADSDTLQVNNKIATIEDATKGKVSYAWKTADLADAGEFYGWWFCSLGTTKFSTEEFLVVVDIHAPGKHTKTGAIYRKLQGLIPLTIGALRDSPEYGDRQIQDRIEEAKAWLLLTPVLVDDEGTDLDPRVQTYLAKMAALDIIPAGVDYWASQHISVATGGGTTTEVTTYPDRVGALWKVYERLLIEVKEDAAVIDDIIGTTNNIRSSGQIPAYSDGAATGDFVTPNVGSDFREYSFPGIRTRKARGGWWPGGDW